MENEEEKSTINCKIDIKDLNRDLSNLDIEKIRECLEILEENREKCVKEENFCEAKKILEKIEYFKKMEEEKIEIEAKKIYEIQKEMIRLKEKEKINIFNEKMNEEDNILNKELNEQESKILERHQNELLNIQNNLEENYVKNKKPKPSSQLLNFIKIKEESVKQKNYEKANLANQKIEELSKKDIEKFNIEIDNKLANEIYKLIKKQHNEMIVFKLKCKSIKDSFNIQRKKEFEILQKKYQSKLKELGNYQKVEMNNIINISKGIVKPISRIQNIINQAFHEGEKLEKNKKKDFKIINKKDNNYNKNKKGNKDIINNKIKNKDLIQEQNNQKNNDEFK